MRTQYLKLLELLINVLFLRLRTGVLCGKRIDLPGTANSVNKKTFNIVSLKRSASTEHTEERYSR